MPRAPSPRPQGPLTLLDLAVDVARAGAAVLVTHQRRMREGADLSVRTKSSDTDPVSIADAEAEQAITDAILRHRPDDSILGEEGAAVHGSTDLRWVIDPLDGTVNYLYDHVGWCVSVAVEQMDPDGAPIALAGAVLDPSGDRLHTAHADGPATESTADGQATSSLAVNDPVDLPHALIATGFSYDVAHRRGQAQVAARVLGRARDIRRVGSAALDLCAVAAGRVDGYYEDSTRRWDWAAGALIVRQAGGVVTPLEGGGRHIGVVAAGPALHPQLTAVLADETS